MRQTSENYNPFPDIRSPDVMMTFQVLSTSITKQQIVPYSGEYGIAGTVYDTINGQSMLAHKYATTERYGWPLDGSCYVMPNSGVETGYWTNDVTDENGSFSSPVMLGYTLPKPIHTLGWTFHFDEPTRIYSPYVLAICLDENNELVDEYEGLLEDDALPENGWRLTHSVSGYTTVYFYFYGLNEPYRLFRLVEVDFGLSRTFTKDDFAEVDFQYELALDGSALPAKKLSFVFDNSDKEFNVLNPIDVYQYWRNGQSVSGNIRIGDDVINMGTFFISRAEIGQNYLTAKVTAYDQVKQLGEQKFYPGTLNQQDYVTLQTAVEKVLDGYDIGVEYNGLGSEKVCLKISDNHTKRAVLHYLAQAVRASVWIDRDNTVQFKRLEVKSTPDAELTADALYNWSGVSVAEEVRGVTLTVQHDLDEDTPTVTYTSGTPDAEGDTAASYSNPCVYEDNGQDVADWLLVMANMAKKYAVKNRCDPAVEIGDTYKIADVFENDDSAIISGIDIHYDGVLSSLVEASGEFAADSTAPLVGIGAADQMTLTL